MKSFEGISFLWAIGLFVLIGGIYGLRAWLGYRNVARDAASDYDYKHPQGMIPAGLSRAQYEAIYRRVHAPRAPGYIAVTVLGLLIATPIAMILLEQGLNFIYNVSGQPRSIEPGYLVWQFFLFFGVIATWVGVAYLAARRYHRLTPGNLQSEIDDVLYGGDDYGQDFG
jgi:hypothetical protein